MFVTNTIKVGGCTLMLFYAVPSAAAAYAVVGFGAAAYSPAKYGILTELLPPQQLVNANGWIEGTTVGSIILGTVLGGALVATVVSSRCWASTSRASKPASTRRPRRRSSSSRSSTASRRCSTCSSRTPGWTTACPAATRSSSIREFAHCISLLWRDKLGQISLATTTLFWGAGATLQFIVLEWAEQSLGMNLSQAAILQAVVAVGIAVGAVRRGHQGHAAPGAVDPAVGVAMGLIVMVLAMYSRWGRRRSRFGRRRATC